MNFSFKSVASFSLSLGLGLFALLLASFNYRLFDDFGLEVFRAGPLSLIFCLSFLLIGIFSKSEPKASWLVGGILVLFWFLSDLPDRNYVFFPGVTVRGEIFLFGLLAWLAINRLNERFFICFLLGSVGLLVACFFVQSSGRVLLYDDHSSVFYRLLLLKQNFPWIPSYNVMWNAGVDARDFFATGIFNIVSVFWPIIWNTNLFSSYNYMIAALLFGIVPASTYLAARILRCERATASIAAILSMAATLFWYRWALKYGTLGFIFSIALLPLNLALIWRLLLDKQIASWKLVILSIISLSLMFFWSLSAALLLPASFLVLFNWRALLSRRYLAFFLVAMLCLNLPWTMVFLKVSNVTKFVATKHASFDEQHEVGYKIKQERQVTEGPFWKKSLKVLRNNLISANPILLFLGGVGLLFMPVAGSLWGLTVLWCLVLAGLSALKPQLELDRMVVIGIYLLCIPAAQSLFRILKLAQIERKLLYKLNASLCVAVLCLSPLYSGLVVRSRNVEKYSFASGNLYKLAELIQLHGGEGRVLFSGFVLHELDGMHLAPLGALTDKPLMATSYMHDLWHYKEMIPARYVERGAEGIEEYLDLYNVTAVISHKSSWEDYFRKSASYEFVGKVGKFSLFKRTTSNQSYFYRGSGEIVSQDTHGVRLRLNSSQAVLKFSYLPFLTSTGCILQPHVVDSEIKLIELSNCPPGQEIEIKSGNPVIRLRGK